MIRTNNARRGLVYVTALAVGLAAVAGTALAQGQLAPTVPGREITLLLFPVNVEAETAPADTSRWATTALQTTFEDLEGVICLDFSRSSPLVRRAVREGRVRTVDTEQRVTDPRTAITIGNAMEADMVLLATVQSYKLTLDPTQVEVVLAGQIYDVKSNFDEQTQEAKTDPQVFRALGVVGRSKVRGKYDGAEAVLAREALRDAAFRAAQVAQGTPAEKVGAAPAPKKKDKAWRWFVLAAVVVGLAAAANNSGGRAPAAPATSDYKPRNLVADVQPAGQNSINCQWLPPRITTNLLGYELQRAVGLPGSTGPGSYQTIAGYLQLPPGRLYWLDHSLDPRNVYYYRLRARYSDRPAQDSDWIYTGGVSFSSSG